MCNKRKDCVFLYDHDGPCKTHHELFGNDTTSESRFMSTGDALEIVFDLAKQNALDIDKCELDFIEEARKQRLALNTIEDLIVNNFGND